MELKAEARKPQRQLHSLPARDGEQLRAQTPHQQPRRSFWAPPNGPRPQAFPAPGFHLRGVPSYRWLSTVLSEILALMPPPREAFPDWPASQLLLPSSPRPFPYSALSLLTFCPSPLGFLTAETLCPAEHRWCRVLVKTQLSDVDCWVLIPAVPGMSYVTSASHSTSLGSGQLVSCGVYRTLSSCPWWLKHVEGPVAQ